MKSALAACALLLVGCLSAVPALAVDRSLSITAPEKVKAGTAIHVALAASTNAGGKEQVGFFHAEYSTDGGATWQTRYMESMGPKAEMAVDFKAGEAGSKALVRVRVAFRGGAMGDVDFTGKPIVWEGSWGTWETPPAKSVAIEVTAR